MHCSIRGVVNVFIIVFLYLEDGEVFLCEQEDPVLSELHTCRVRMLTLRPRAIIESSEQTTITCKNSRIFINIHGQRPVSADSRLQSADEEILTDSCRHRLTQTKKRRWPILTRSAIGVSTHPPLPVRQWQYIAADSCIPAAKCSI